MKRFILIALTAFALPGWARVPKHVCGTMYLRHLHQLGVLPKLPVSAAVKKLRAAPTPYKVGDQHAFWTYDLSVMPPRNVQVMATCRAVGVHAYVFVADDQWNVTVDQAKVDAMVKAFDTSTPASDEGIFEKDTTTFGDPPDIDGRSRIILLVYKIAGYQGYTFDGFFRPQDEQPFDPDCKTNPKKYCSNEAEMLHLNTKGIGTDYMNGVIAHEFQHLIHYNYDPEESTWLNEGMSELAMTINGYKDQENLDGFTVKHDAPLIPGAGQQTVNYGAVMLFGVYFYENLPPGSVKKLVQDTNHDIPSVETQLKLGKKSLFNEFFAHMAAAVLLDTPKATSMDFGYTAGFGELDFAKPQIDGEADMSTGVSGSFQADFDVEPYTFKFLRIKIDQAHKGWYLNLKGVPNKHDVLCVVNAYKQNPANNLVECTGFIQGLEVTASHTDGDAMYLVLANADVQTWSKPVITWEYKPSQSSAEHAPSAEHEPGYDNCVASDIGSINDIVETASNDAAMAADASENVSDATATDANFSAHKSSGGSCCTSPQTPDTRNSWFILVVFFGAVLFSLRIFWSRKSGRNG